MQFMNFWAFCPTTYKLTPLSNQTAKGSTKTTGSGTNLVLWAPPKRGGVGRGGRVVERIPDSYILDWVGLLDYRLSCFVVSYALSEFALILPCPPSTHYWFPFHLLLLASFSSQSHILSSQKKLIEPINGTFYQKPFSTRTKHINLSFWFVLLPLCLQNWCQTNKCMIKGRMKVDWPCPDCPGFAEELEGEADEGCERGEAEAKTHLIIVDQLAREWKSK